MEDKRITELFTDRQENAIEELLAKYGRLFRSLAINILGNDEDAEECVNDSCMEIWNAIPPANPQFLMPFACKIVRRVAINRLRYNLRQKRSADNTVFLSELSECIPTSDEMSYMIDSEHFNKLLNDFLRGLDDESKALFVRRYFMLESLSQVAKHLGISENNASVKLHRIRKKLALKLKEEGVYE